MMFERRAFFPVQNLLHKYPIHILPSFSMLSLMTSTCPPTTSSIVFGLWFYSKATVRIVNQTDLTALSQLALSSPRPSIAISATFSNLDAQAKTQFQGSGSSHELAALLVTEAVQHFLFVQHEPVFLLLLDAKSAFDKILTEICQSRPCSRR